VRIEFTKGRTGKQNNYVMGNEFTETQSDWHVYSDYELATIPNPIPQEKRPLYKHILPSLDELTVVRPVKGATVEKYNPLEKGSSARLLTELVKLNVQTGEKEILRFVKSFGVLGMAFRWRKEDGFGEYFNALDMDQGEPLVYIKEQASRLSQLLYMYNAIQNKDFVILKNQIEPYYSVVKEGERGSFVDFFTKGGDGIFGPINPIMNVTEDTYFQAGLYYIACQINNELKNRAGVGVSVCMVNKEWGLIPDTYISSLQTCIYWQLRDLVVGMDELKRCKYCGSLFKPKTAKQVCCPPLLGESKPPCRNRRDVAKAKHPKNKNNS